MRTNKNTKQITEYREFFQLWQPVAFPTCAHRTLCCELTLVLTQRCAPRISRPLTTMRCVKAIIKRDCCFDALCISSNRFRSRANRKTHAKIPVKTRQRRQSQNNLRSVGRTAVSSKTCVLLISAASALVKLIQKSRYSTWRIRGEEGAC